MNGSQTLQYPDITMYEKLSEICSKYPKNTAYQFFGKNVSFKEFDKKISDASRAFIACGIKKDDVVTICMPNTPQAIISFYALNKIGAVSNMVHPLSAPSEIAYYMNLSKSKALITLDMFYEKINSVAGEIENDFLFIVSCISDEMSSLLKVGYKLTQKKYKLSENNFISWKEFINRGRECKYIPPSGKKANDLAVILYSGGTTGTNKGIKLSNLNFNALAIQTAKASEINPCPEMKLKMLSVMPIFHGFGLGICIHMALIYGMTALLIPKFTVNSYADILKKKKPNFIVGVPTLYEALLRNPQLKNVDLSCLLGVFSGGDSLSVALKKKVDEFLKEHNASVQIREGYGMTECVAASCLTPKDVYREGSIGLPFADTCYKIVKPETTDEVAVGELGEICICGPSVMMGYFNNESENNNTLRPHADQKIWLHTGDIGKMDSDGFVYFVQRLKRMIVSSGYNIYPSQIENILDSHPFVFVSCVVGVPDPYKMQKVKAFVVLRDGYEKNDDTKNAIMQYCKRHIAKYALPYDMEFCDELPKTLIGKVDYRSLEKGEA